MNTRAHASGRERRGFTLIELLTVIAIIALLAAILFPVFAQVRNQMQKSRCMTNLKSILQAMNVYKEDYGVFPEALYGVQHQGKPLELRLAKFVKDDNVFVCPNMPESYKRSDVVVVPINPMTQQPTVNRQGNPMGFPQRSAYDMQYRPAQGGQPYLNYSPKWTGWSNAGVSDISPRQLAYKNPPSDTVVTMCLYHANPQAPQTANGSLVFPVEKGKMALVAFLNGRVQDIPAERVATWDTNQNRYPWLIEPKP